MQRLFDVASGSAQLTRRLLRYGIVGLVVSLLYSFAVVLLVARLHMGNATQASAVAFAVVQPIAYFAHRHVTFFDAAGDPFQPLRFAVTTVSTFLIAIGGMYVVTDMLGHSYLFGIALNWAMIPAGNFLAYLLWVFRLGNQKADATVLASAGAGEALERT